MPKTDVPRPRLGQNAGEIEALVRRLRELTSQSPDAWEGVDLTFAQLRALFLLSARQPLRVSDLADALRMSLASGSALSDRLVRMGLVARRSDATDRRIVLLTLDVEGARLLGGLERRSTAKLRLAVARMTAPERAAFVTVLRALIRGVARGGAGAPSPDGPRAGSR